MESMCESWRRLLIAVDRKDSVRLKHAVLTDLPGVVCERCLAAGAAMSLLQAAITEALSQSKRGRTARLLFRPENSPTTIPDRDLRPRIGKGSPKQKK